MDVALLHSLSELLTSTAELVGVIGLLAVFAYLGSAIRDRIRSGADLDMKLPGSALRVTGGMPVTGRDVLTEVIEVVPDMLGAIADLTAKVEVLEAAAAAKPTSQLPAPTPPPAPAQGGELKKPSLLWVDHNPASRMMQIAQASEAGWDVQLFVNFERSVADLERTFYDGVVYVWGGGTPLSDVTALTGVIKRQPIDKRTRLLVYTVEDRLPKPRLDDVLREGATMVTASAVELAVALAGTYCGSCGRLLAEPSAPFPSRLPCPQCGSTRRQFKRELSGNLNATSRLSGTLDVTSTPPSGSEG